ncbi:efflux RND transporter periplasmic adaptor subunit [Desulfosarcina ovata]|uniref:Hemolysin secretion protein D n=1 Tax=Desulfosarcina ovata subsp. ovata TaxID=2752305 RepID=A0A5K8ALR0_9BACT|nr:efflux RND transporter periplasmic adaptor subunit [Desulfosarcina ovata]BBO92760.1 hemolysin secretion protein D [Desulfosarcina ovata subsp. ovata]
MLDRKEDLSVQETMQQTATLGRRKRLKRWIVVGVLLLGAAMVIVFGKFRGAPDAVAFQTRPVQRGDLVITVTATGNLEATNEVEVGSELSGIIKSMTADYNDTVKAGQPLAYLDDAKYTAAVMKSKAEVASAQAAHKEAQATLKADLKKLQRYRKTRELTAGKLPSLEDLETAEADFERAEAALDSAAAAIAVAKASLKSDETDLAKTVIYSPINGVVLSRDVEPGQTVAASLEAPVLYTLAEDLRHMELQVDVDEADVGQVREGQTAHFSVDAYPERTFAARITQVRYGAEENDGVVTYTCMLSVDNADLLLLPGMTATANIVVEKVENRLLVPNTALRFTPPRPSGGPPPGKGRGRGLLASLMPGPPRHPGARKSGADGPPMAPDFDRPAVWVLRDGHPMPVPVEKGLSDGVLTAVTSDELQAGTPLIVSTVTTDG